MIIPVVLSGGSGTRLWPVSRTKLPKQFSRIFQQSLQEMTLLRLSHLSTPWIITSTALNELTAQQLSGLSIPLSQMVLEPRSKNTAPAIALICRLLQLKGRTDEVMGIFPSDHLIENEANFFAALNLAEKEARAEKIVTLGVKPAWPATGYGYIQVLNKPGARQGRFAANPVMRFHEKPDAKTAESFLKDGGFFWNAGIFVFRIGTMIKAFEKNQPTLWKLMSTLREDLSNIDEVFVQVDNISIDYAILEKLSPDELSCIPCDIGWSDIGSWDAIAEIMGQSPTELVEADAKGNFVHGRPGRTYAFAGVEDLIVVDTPDALLVTRKGQSQKVKDVVELLKLKNNKVVQDPSERV